MVGFLLDVWMFGFLWLGQLMSQCLGCVNGYGFIVQHNFVYSSGCLNGFYWLVDWHLVFPRVFLGDKFSHEPLICISYLNVTIGLYHIYIQMRNESSRNLEADPEGDPDATGEARKESKIKFQRSTSRVDMDQLNPIEQRTSFLGKIFCLHHLKTALSYICQINKDNLIKYSPEYQPFIGNTKLRDIALQRSSNGEQFQGLWQAFKLQRFAIFLILFLSLCAGAASVVIIYYQQTLAKYIITQTPDQQWKWFGVIVGCIVARFLVFNYCTALTSNVAINVKVNLQNLFMRAIFFLDHGREELTMQRMRYLAIDSVIQAITFIPYLLVAFCTIVGVVVLVFNLNNYYGFVYFGVVLFCLLLHIILLCLVYARLRKNEEVKDEIAEESKWVFRSLVPLVFDRISEAITSRILKIKDESLECDRLYNACYSFSQFLADLTSLVPIIIYYGLNNDKIKDMTLQNTYLTAVYLGMLYFPAKIFVFGSYTILRGLEQYFSMTDNFRNHINERKVNDLHLSPPHQLNTHAYPDNLGDCFNYAYDQQQQKEIEMPSPKKIQKSQSNLFMQVSFNPGETVMTYFSTDNQTQIQRYIRQLVNSLPINQTVALINEKHFVIPDTFQQNILFYSEYKEERFHEILRLMELEYFIPQIQALGNTALNYRIAKYYPWHQSRLELARALYNSVDYLLINKSIIIEDQQLMRAVIDFRKKEGKVTIIANNWHIDAFSLADRLLLFDKDRREMGTYRELSRKEDSILNEVHRQLKKQGVETLKSQEISTLHENFLTLVKKQPKPLQLQRSIYFKFFEFAHRGGGLVVLLALLAPISFKIYMNWLVGQTLKMVIYPDILTFGVIYLCLVLLRGFVIAFYFRSASSGLFARIMEEQRSLCGDQILNIYKEKDDRIENDFRKVDSNLVVCFQLGMSVLFQAWGGLVIVGIGQPIVLAMGVPLVILTAIVNVLYNKIQRSVLVLRTRYEQQLQVFINHCTTRALAIFKYGHYNHLQKKYHELHKIMIVFACNQMWILSGMRMLGEIIIIIGVTIFLVIMIQTQSKQVSNLAMVSYGVSLFINMSFSYRFNLKTFAIVETQMLALTKCVQFYQIVKEEEKCVLDEGEKQPIDVETIEYKDVSIDFGSNQCSKVNLFLKKGDRVAVSADSKSLATLPFYLLRRKMFSMDHVKGEILINGTPRNHFTIDGLFYFHFRPLLPTFGDVFSICSKWSQGLTIEECNRQLTEFFKQLDLSHLFTAETPLNQLSIGYEQLLNVFRSMWYEKVKVLVMISAFDYLDILTRIKIERYLISRKDISIIICMTNNPEITTLYPRHLQFRQQQFTEQTEVSRKQE